MRRCPTIPWLGLLCLWLPLLGGQPVSVSQVRADIKGLAKTIVTRIQQQRESASGSGLDFIPEDLPAASLGTMGQALSVFQQVLPQLPQEEPVDQIAFDLENLRSLLSMLCRMPSCRLGSPRPCLASLDWASGFQEEAGGSNAVWPKPRQGYIQDNSAKNEDRFKRGFCPQLFVAQTISCNLVCGDPTALSFSEAKPCDSLTLP
uniref:Leptin n=1 Tax=Varanus komodoensis TaxID=61221 RepID=A0A8D2LV22_VARKO